MSLALPTTILAIDDDPRILKALQSGLSGEYEVLTASSTAEAELLLHKNVVKVLICDDTMPGETGIMFMARLRDQFPLMRRILLTGNIDPEVVIFAVNEAGIFRYMNKPVRLGDLKKLVREGVAAFDEAHVADKALHENRKLKKELVRHENNGVASTVALTPPRGYWAGMLLGGLAVLAVLFVVGVLLLLALYILKSFLGIDFFENMHFQDLFH